MSRLSETYDKSITKILIQIEKNIFRKIFYDMIQIFFNIDCFYSIFKAIHFLRSRYKPIKEGSRIWRRAAAPSSTAFQAVTLRPSEREKV
ncbi:hypothetical protein JGUZn3_05460 [Entomobacter blattae]|uniref:Uncharacterized protein n=1 Tax=Entomobacter blattae TaxID=2762277 RepID=A0A7H1NPT2_9PROT|nr:hypothetical protein JGUZn3_05460 [Entomobacter blattae]